MLRFGSFQGRVVSSQEQYLDALRLVFGAGVHPPNQNPNAGRQFEMVIEDAPIPAGSAVSDSNVLTLGGTPTCRRITTDALRAELEPDRDPVPIRISVLRDDISFPALSVHFVVVIHKLLFLLDRVILHAAAVELDGQVSLFVGNKGAGKSSTSLALAKAGGTVLGEDQVVLRKTGAGYLVSGGDERSRVTEHTERHFFPEPLTVPARDFAGTMKKEVMMRDFFRSEPFRDFPAHRLVFPRVTGQFGLRPLKAQAALLRLMAFNGHFQRFEGARDQAAFLDFLAGFIASVSCWELTLSDDLTNLDQLPGRLRRG
jgi:hypothetical protein